MADKKTTTVVGIILVVGVLLTITAIVLLALIIGLSVGLRRYCNSSVITSMSQKEPICFQYTTSTSTLGVIGGNLISSLLGIQAGPLQIVSTTFNYTYTLNTTNIYSVPCGLNGCERIDANFTSQMFRYSTNGLSNVSLVYTPPSPCTRLSNITIYSVYMNVDSTSTICLATQNTDPNFSNDVFVTGRGFVFEKNSTFTPLVTIGSRNFSLSYNNTDCDETPTYRVCSRFKFKVTSNDLNTYTLYNMTVKNNYTTGCSITKNFFIPSYSTITGASTQQLCSQLSGSQIITVDGTGFFDGSNIYLTRNGQVFPSIKTTFVSSTRVTVEFSSTYLSGVYQLAVSNANCITVSNIQVTYLPLSLVVYIDPSTIYSGIRNQLTIYTSGFSNAATNVQISNNITTQDVTFSIEQGNFNKIYANVPTGIADGKWNVIVRNSNGCQAVSNTASFNSKSLTSLNVTSVDPAYIFTNDTTSVTIVGLGFNQAPLVYLVSKNNQNTLPISLLAVSQSSSTVITAVIPSGVNPDVYNVIIVNQDGTVGVLNAGVNVTSSPTPQVASVSPSALTTAGGTSVITGSNFQNVTVSLDCQGSTTPTQVTVNSWTSTQINVNIPGLTAGTICLLVVTNRDNSFFRFSAITFKSASSNLQGFQYSSNNMNFARRSFCLVSGKPTLSSRYLYAIGGVNSTSLMNSVEVANIDRFGSVGSWVNLRNLPEKIGNQDCVVVGSYIYMVGGLKEINSTFNDVSDTLYRAKILDPLATPTPSLSITLNQSSLTSMPTGLFFYKVSANFASNDLVDPNGETLPGVTATVNIPNVSGLSVILTWDSIPNAQSYNLYRTPISGSSISNLQLLTTVTTTSFIDSNQFTPNPSRKPLPDGALGNWVQLGSNNALTKRWSHAVTSAQSSSNPNTFHIYSIGGRSATNTYLSSIEFINVTITPPSITKGYETHNLTSWIASAFSLQTARSDLSAFTVGNSELSVIPSGQRWIYIGVGETGTNTFTSQLDAQSITSTGEFAGAFSAYSGNLQNPSASNAGVCFLSNSANLLISGGISGGNPTTSGISAIQCLANGGGCSGPYPPTTKSWNNNGAGKLAEARYQFKCVLDTAFIFAVGGRNTVSISNTVEQSLA